jgi:hypothetical protein
MGEPFKGFTAPAYATEASVEAIGRTVNFYHESVEVPGVTKPSPALLPSPGTAAYGSNPPQAIGRARGKLTYNEITYPVIGPVTAYGVNGTHFYLMEPSGNQHVLGTVIDDGNPVIMCGSKPTANNNRGQIGIASGGQLYMYSDGVFALVPISDNFFGADYLTWIDGYWIALQRDLSQFQIAFGDGTIWNALDVSGTLGQADRLQAIMADKEYLYLLGERRGEIWYNTGNAGFPFGIESGAFIENGIGANYSLCQSNNSLYWLDQSSRGAGSAVRSEGLITRRVSTHALEAAWANKDPEKGKVYPTTDDCICYSFIWHGHTLIKWIFPSADAAWLYDATESDRLGDPVWTESTFTALDGSTHACLERDHCYAYGKHIVGSGGADGAPGVMYSFDDSTYYDAPNPAATPAFAGFPIVRDRVVRLPWNGGLRQFLDRLEFICQVGVGVDSGQGSNPQMMLRISRDGGKTWGAEKWISLGPGGAYQTRVIANRLGSYRDGAVWIRVSDPAFFALIGAEYYARPGVS